MIVVDDPTALPPVRIPVLSESGSAHAPFLYFEEAPTLGYMNGIIRITLEAGRQYSPTLGEVVTDRVVVAYLRTNIQGALALKAAIESALLLANPAGSEAKN